MSVIKYLLQNQNVIVVTNIIDVWEEGKEIDSS